jgi:hypothetical protein
VLFFAFFHADIEKHSGLHDGLCKETGERSTAQHIVCFSFRVELRCNFLHGLLDNERSGLYRAYLYVASNARPRDELAQHHEHHHHQLHSPRTYKRRSSTLYRQLNSTLIHPPIPFFITSGINARQTCFIHTLLRNRFTDRVCRRKGSSCVC